MRPIYAIRPGAEGDISLQKGQESSQSIAWSNMTEGTYIPTPLVYDGYLFTLNINGIVTAYDPQTGKRAFRGRVGTGGAFSASPVAADGRLYVASEDGEVYVDHGGARADADREERHEGSDHGDARDLRRPDRRADAGPSVRHRAVNELMRL